MAGKVAIIGAGPSGCFLAQALVKARPETEITVIDRLPVPYGLVRYGVAADHQGTKAITRQLARLFERQGVGFLGNLGVGDAANEVSLDDLRTAMDAVVIATGLEADRKLDVAGASLPGVIGAGALTRFWNGHPDAAPPAPPIGERVGVLGNGNVAVDILRILIKGTDDFSGSDFDPALVCRHVREVHVIGRAPLSAARFDTVMIKELAQIPGVTFALAEGDSAGVPESAQASAVLALCNRAVPEAEKSVTFHSGWNPTRVHGNDRVRAVSLASTQDARSRLIDCDTLVTAIGFVPGASLDRAALLAGTEAGQSVLGEGLFATGWFKRGPRGTIPDNRADAQGVAALVIDHLASISSDKPGRAALLDRFGSQLTDYDDWRALDEAERAAALPDRCRAKLTTRPAMQAIIDARRHTA